MEVFCITSKFKRKCGLRESYSTTASWSVIRRKRKVSKFYFFFTRISLTTLIDNVLLLIKQVGNNSELTWTFREIMLLPGKQAAVESNFTKPKNVSPDLIRENLCNSCLIGLFLLSRQQCFYCKESFLTVLSKLTKKAVFSSHFRAPNDI